MTTDSLKKLRDAVRTAESVGDLQYFFQALDEFFYHEDIFIPRLTDLIEDRMHHTKNNDAVEFIEQLKTIADINTDQELEEVVVAGVDNGCREELQRVKSELRTLWMSLSKSV